MRFPFLASSVVLLAACSSDKGATPPPVDPACASDAPADAPTPKRHTPRWAFEPWISKDISTSDDTRAFVDGFRTRDIPVGVVVLDSPWETNYHTFVPNPSRYGGFDGLVDEMHGKNVKVVLWMTSLINESSVDYEDTGDTYTEPAPAFDPGQRCKFFVNDGESVFWWKGRGAAVDFFNPQARSWWHGMQRAILPKIDGWKLDFGESYITTTPLRTAAGSKPLQEYSEAYYRDFLAYSVSVRGPEFTTMVRPWDASYHFAGRFYARPEDAPVAWVGDNRRDWIGLADALDSMMRSARAGYVVLGSDIGGYLDHDDKDLTQLVPFDHANFSRWVAVGALSPFMELHGRANLTPWTVPERVDETVTLYRYWATLHHELVPFFYSLAEEAYAGGANLIDPQGTDPGWAGDFRFVLGRSFLVAPILDATGVRDVALPAGSRWYDWWQPAADALGGGQTLAKVDATDRSRIPLYVREGAIVPMSVASALTGAGTAASAGRLTLLVYPGPAKETFRLREDDDSITTIEAEGATVSISRAPKAVTLRVRSDAAPTAVSVDGAALTKTDTAAAFDAAEGAWRYDAATRSTWVRIAAAGAKRTVAIAP